MTIPALTAEARRILDALPPHFAAVQFARFVVAVAEMLDDGDALDVAFDAWLDSDEACRRAFTADLERRMAEMERSEMGRAWTENGDRFDRDERCPACDSTNCGAWAIATEDDDAQA